MNTIETKKLTKYYLNGKVIGIKNLDLTVKEGEIFGFIGPNGAGKSTTIRLFLDLIRPTDGNGKIFDLDIHKKTVQIKQEIGYLPGEVYLNENITGDECIKYYSKFKKKIDSNYLKDILIRLDLDTSKRIKTYSKGNKQKLAIALTLMHKPKLLILDEPTSGLDPLNQQTFYDLIAETKRWGTTVFFSTHILSEVEKLCDRVGIIKNGKLLKIEDIDDFREKNIREIHIKTSDTLPITHFKVSGIKKFERTTDGYRIITIGENANILKKLINDKVLDIRISEPSLEEIFLKYYKE